MGLGGWVAGSSENKANSVQFAKLELSLATMEVATTIATQPVCNATREANALRSDQYDPLSVLCRNVYISLKKTKRKIL